VKRVKQIDNILVSRIKQDDRDAFEMLFRKYYSILCNFGYRYISDHSIIEDMVQETFIKFWEHRKQLSHGRAIKSYLFQMVRNEILNHQKHHSIKQKALAELKYEQDCFGLNDLAGDDDNNQKLEQLRSEFKAALAELPDRCKEIFLMSRDDGLTYREIADVLDLSIKTVETQMSRAFKKMRHSLSDYYY
jgi:RNA polymerase sigma-70 factor (ECF subfamily)